MSGLAAFNAMYVPLHLEQVIHSNPRSTALLIAAQASDWPSNLNTTSAGKQSEAFSSSRAPLDPSPFYPLTLPTICPKSPHAPASLSSVHHKLVVNVWLGNVAECEIVSEVS